MKAISLEVGGDLGLNKVLIHEVDMGNRKLATYREHIKGNITSLRDKLSGFTMKDGTQATRSSYSRYFFRVSPDDHLIEYYTLSRSYIPLACAECLHCGDIVKSLRCGDYVSCQCGKVSVDTDRWMPERHRYIGHQEDMRILW